MTVIWDDEDNELFCFVFFGCRDYWVDEPRLLYNCLLFSWVMFVGATNGVLDLTNWHNTSTEEPLACQMFRTGIYSGNKMVGLFGSRPPLDAILVYE